MEEKSVANQGRLELVSALVASMLYIAGDEQLAMRAVCRSFCRGIDRLRGACISLNNFKSIRSSMRLVPLDSPTPPAMWAVRALGRLSLARLAANDPKSRKAERIARIVKFFLSNDAILPIDLAFKEERDRIMGMLDKSRRPSINVLVAFLWSWKLDADGSEAPIPRRKRVRFKITVPKINRKKRSVTLGDFRWRYSGGDNAMKRFRSAKKLAGK